MKNNSIKNYPISKIIWEYNQIINEVKLNYKKVPELEDNYILDLMIKKSPSTINRIRKIKKSLSEKWLNEFSVIDFILDNINIIVSSWAKGNIKGKILNKLVLEKIKSVVGNDAEVKSEILVDSIKTDELVDFAVKFRNGKYIVGFNQISLWWWWHQINRFGKYLNIIKNNDNVFLVVYDIPKIKNNESKSKLINYIVEARKTGQLIWLHEVEDKIRKILINQKSK